MLCCKQAMEQQEVVEAQKDVEVPEGVELQREEAMQKAAEAREEAEMQKEAEVQKDAEVRKDREISTERKGSNEPIMPMEELLGTALSSEPHPESAKQLSTGTGVNAGDGVGSLQAFGRGMRQASVQDLEKQHQNMAAAQKQVACSPPHNVNCLSVSFPLHVLGTA